VRCPPAWELVKWSELVGGQLRFSLFVLLLLERGSRGMGTVQKPR
jgi:hypothetical protein